eukprot:1144595-Pelagomonas_calceolata.AAC.5
MVCASRGHRRQLLLQALDADRVGLKLVIGKGDQVPAGNKAGEHALDSAGSAGLRLVIGKVDQVPVSLAAKTASKGK